MPLDYSQFSRNDAIACYHEFSKTVIIKGRYDWLQLPNGNLEQVLLIQYLKCLKDTSTSRVAAMLCNDKPIWTNRHIGLDKALGGSTYTFDFDDVNLHDIPAMDDTYKELKAENKFVLARDVNFDSGDASQYKCLQLLLMALQHAIHAPIGGGRAIASRDLRML